MDAEQIPPGMLKCGLEMGDLMIPHAPKPLILLGQEQDFFDVRGIHDVFERLKHFWGLFGAEDNLQLFVGPEPHGFSRHNREAMYSFFGKHSGMDTSPEPEITIEEDETLQCTDSGCVAELEPNIVFDFISERSRQLAAKRGAVAGRELRKAVVKHLDLPERTDGPPHFRVLRPLSRSGYPENRNNIAVYLLETDEKWGARAVAYKLEETGRVARPLPGDGQATLWIPHHSSDEDLRKNEVCRELAGGSEPMFTCDYRGIGESIPNTCAPGSFEGIYGSDYFYAGYAEMFGESYVSWRVHDILRTLDFMASFGYDRVHVAAYGWGTIPAALSSFLDGRVFRVSLHQPPNSWSDMAQTKMQKWPFSGMLHGVLKEFDLPDIYRELTEVKKLKI